MANKSAPSGFHPVRHKTGGEIRMTKYAIASTYGTALGKGDPVELTGTGKNIQLSAAGNVNSLGVFAGCSYTDATGEKRFSEYWPAGTVATEIVALVWDDPMIIFAIQGDSVAEADIGALADWTVGTPSAVTGLSTTFLAVNGATATSGKGARILRLAETVNNAYGAYAKIETMFAEHMLLTGTDATGGV
jgi:hypothetical protein